MDLLSTLVVDGVAFGRTVIGLMSRPYETYRRIVAHGRVGEIWYLGALLAIYFALASVVKVAAFRPFLFTRQFVLLGVGVASGVAISVVCMWIAGKLLGAKPQLSTLLLAWSYTLIPTVSWFFVTSLLYVLLPPPRTTSAAGIVFSLLFLVFSATLLWWKVTLSYLVLRFCFKFDLGKSIMVALLCAPVLALWSVAMYGAGIFKVPFL